MKRGPFYSVEILSRIKSSKSFCSNSAKAQPTKFVQDDFQTERINNTHTHTELHHVFASHETGGGTQLPAVVVMVTL